MTSACHPHANSAPASTSVGRCTPRFTRLPHRRRYDPGKPAVDLAGPTVFVGDLPSRPMGPASTLARRRAGTCGRRKTLEFDVVVES